MLDKLALPLLGPVLMRQGKRVRRTLPRLPEPDGDRDSQRGSGPPLRLLLVGDSSAAGVGAPHQDDALLGQLLTQLAARFEVRFRLIARTGDTTRTLLARLEAAESFPCDVAITALGVNDLTSRVGLRAWLEQQERLRTLLFSRFEARHLLVSGFPPVHLFPALPQPLRWYLGSAAKRYDRMLRRALRADPRDVRYVYVPVNALDAREAMADDGFHPGPRVYAAWARALAAAIDVPRS